MKRQKIEELIWDNLDTSGGPNACWEWRGTRPGEYGTVRIDGRGVLAHRLVYETAVEPIPEGMMVCHHCDNPPCCNPTHLFLGTAHDNIRDMMSKGRQGWTERLKPQRIDIGDAMRAEILNRHMAGDENCEIARALGVYGQTVSHTIRVADGPCLKIMQDDPIQFGI